MSCGIVMSLGVWGQRWIESSLSLKNLDPSLLMWDMRRSVSTASFPNRKCTVKFTYPELSATRNSWWIVVADGAVDLCSVDPGYEVDLYVRGACKAGWSKGAGGGAGLGQASKRPYHVTSPTSREQYPGSDVGTGWAGNR